MFNLKKVVAVSALAFTTLTASLAFAGAPSPNVYDGGNRWLITAYNDSSPVHAQMATQGLCFLPYAQVGTHIRGRWYSDTYPDWNGIYSQEGDQVILHGDYASDEGHDGIQFDIATDSEENEGAGHWTEWREDGSYGNTVVFANAKLQRVGKCRTASIDSIFIQPRMLESGAQAEDPMQEGQVKLDSLQLNTLNKLDKLDTFNTLNK